MENADKSDGKNDKWGKGVFVDSKSKPHTPFRSLPVMMAILAAVLDILLLLLRAHFNRNDDQDRALASMRDAQTKLADLATAFETQVRYSAYPQAEVDLLQDTLDSERKKNEPSSHL